MGAPVPFPAVNATLDTTGGGGTGRFMREAPTQPYRTDRLMRKAAFEDTDSWTG